MLKGAKFSDTHKDNIRKARIGTKASEETKAKMRASQQARRAAFPMSDETRAKMSASKKGKLHSEEAKAKMSAAKKGKPGRKLSEEEKANLRAVNIGRSPSEETREKMRQAKLGKPGFWTGKKRGEQTPEWKAAISASNKGRVMSAETRLAISKTLTGQQHTPERIKNIRAAVKGKGLKGSMNPRWGKPAPHTKRTKRFEFYYEGWQFRSSYEKAFAKFLDKQGIEWFYEPYTFDLGDCTYTPDFWIPEFDAYWDTKGWLGPDSQRKTRLFRELYPEISLVVATKPVLQLMGVLNGRGAAIT